MVFKNRVDAGKQLAALIQKKLSSWNTGHKSVVLSLLRGGAVVGREIAHTLSVAHYPLAVAKIPSPYDSELAIGAICQDTVYLQKDLIAQIGLSQIQVEQQTKLARAKQKQYLLKYKINELSYRELIKNRIVFLVDDGVATGSTVLAASRFVSRHQPRQLYLAVPVMARRFQPKAFDDIFVLDNPEGLTAISEFYHDFPQVNDHEIKTIFGVDKARDFDRIRK